MTGISRSCRGIFMKSSTSERNTVPDALSQLELATFDDGLPDLNQWSVDQANDTELQDLLTGRTESSLELDARHTANGPVYFDIAYNRSRLFVPQKHRRTIFTTLHRQAHGGSANRQRTCRFSRHGSVNTAMGQNVLTVSENQGTQAHGDAARTARVTRLTFWPHPSRPRRAITAVEQRQVPSYLRRSLHALARSMARR